MVSDIMKQYLITTATGKRLIGKALAEHPKIQKILKSGTIVIIAGTTNGYVAEEILSKINQDKDFSRNNFFRGIVLPPDSGVNSSGRLNDGAGFLGDVVIKDGVWLKGKTIFDVVNDLKNGDIILKGCNALNYPLNQAAVYIGDPYGGTIGSSIQAVVGRRVQLIIPVGLEKRVYEDLNNIARELNGPYSSGPRLFPISGEIFTEIEAISHLTGAKAELVASGGVGGAEGSIWLGLTGNDKEMDSAQKLIQKVIREPNFNL